MRVGSVEVLGLLIGLVLLMVLTMQGLSILLAAPLAAIFVAVTNGLLDPGRYFYPNRPILRQEVIKILEKTHALQEKLEKLFIHD